MTNRSGLGNTDRREGVGYVDWGSNAYSVYYCRKTESGNQGMAGNHNGRGVSVLSFPYMKVKVDF